MIYRYSQEFMSPVWPQKGPAIDDLYHLAAEPSSKSDLLVGLRDRLGWDDVEPAYAVIRGNG